MKDKYFNLFLPFSWLLILLFCVFLFSFTSKAATNSNTEIPYIVPNWRNANSCIPDEAIQSAEIRYINDVRNYFGYQGDLSYLCFVQDGLIINGSYYQIFFITNPTITDSYIDDYDFSNGYINVNSNNIQIIACNVRVSDFVTTGDAINLGWSASLCGNSSTTTVNGGNLTPRYPFYMVGTDDIKSANDNVIFTNIAPVVIPTGHATAPDNIDEPVFPTGHARPNQVPQLTINNYTWTTPPTPDLSTLENTAESIYNYLFWLGSNLIGAIGNIVTNIQNVGTFLAETLQYYLGLIIDAIKNSINTFYNNMVSLFEPIATAISYITSPIDANVINAAFTSTDFYGVKSQFTSTFNTFDNAFDISEPDSFTLIFNVQNITLFYDFGVRSPVTVDLGANFIPIRQALRTFLWVLVSFGSVFVVEHGLANWLRGERNT